MSGTRDRQGTGRERAPVLPRGKCGRKWPFQAGSLGKGWPLRRTWAGLPGLAGHHRTPEPPPLPGGPPTRREPGPI